MNDPGCEKFSYGYMAFRSEALLSAEVLSIKQGARTHVLGVSSLTHLVLRARGKLLMLLLGEKGSGGGIVVHKFYGNPGDPGFLALVDAIVARRSDIDFRGKDDRCLPHAMRARSGGWLVVALLLLGVPIAVGVVLLPWLVHGLDYGEERVSIAGLSRGRVPHTRNLVITGVLVSRSDAVEFLAKRRNGAGGESSRVFVPLVPPEWDRSQPVVALLLAQNVSAAEQVSMGRSTAFRGISRDFWWEGLSRSERAQFERETGLSLANDVMLVEYRANPRYDLLLYVGCVGVSLFAVLAIGVGLRLRMANAV